jgi:hypothetical protein
VRADDVERLVLEVNVERLGLHEARPVVRTVLDKFVFPLRDYHSIEIVLAEKPE